MLYCFQCENTILHVKITGFFEYNKSKGGEQDMIRARVSEIIGGFAILEFDGIAKVVSCAELPECVKEGDIVFYKDRKTVYVQRNAELNVR